jgi:hypothetical protein
MAFFRDLADGPVRLTFITVDYGKDKHGKHQSLFKVQTNRLYFYCTTPQLPELLLNDLTPDRKIILGSHFLPDITYEHNVASLTKFLF